jgi:hypothetical protein
VRSRSVSRPRAAGAALLVAAFAATATAAATDGGPRRSVPRPADLRGSGVVRDTVLRDGGYVLAARIRSGRFGGVYTTAAGESVTVYSSDAYPQDHAFNQSWANFLGGLLHGFELSRLTVYIAPVAEMHSLCGPQASACYSPSRELMVVPGDAPEDGTPVAELVAHEYGHHLAQNRDNRPWRAVEWGTKRWATHMEICERHAAGTVFPGDEGDHYDLNPGEGFAEAYRLANASSGPRADWNSDQSFYPDDAALDAVRRDAVEPWVGQISRWSVRLRKGGTASWRVAAALDGAVDASVAPAAPATLTLTAADGTKVASARGRVSTVACGLPTYTLTLRAARAGTYTLTLLKP